jgi:hypothetical protein
MVSFFTGLYNSCFEVVCCQPWKGVRYGDCKGHVKLPDFNEIMVYLEKFSCTSAKYIVALSRYLLFLEK